MFLFDYIILGFKFMADIFEAHKKLDKLNKDLYI